MEDNELNRITIEKDNVKLIIEHKGVNQLDVEEMLVMFKGLLQASTYIIAGDLVVESEEE